jgi:hypothetical protein
LGTKNFIINFIEKSNHSQFSLVREEKAID